MVVSAFLVFSGTLLAILIAGFDLRIEFTGSGLRPIFSFGDDDDHFTELENNRSKNGSSDSTSSTTFARQTNRQIHGINSNETMRARTPTDPASQAYWTDFRGPNRDGNYAEMAIRTDWPGTGLEPVWEQPIGGGYASFVIADDRAFTIEQRRDLEVVAAYDVKTGQELWTYSWDAHFVELMGGPGPRATPTWHNGRIYALGATGEFLCLDATTGDVLWSRNILADAGAENLAWAMSASPLVFDDKVIVLPGGSNGWSVVAYDRLTGELRWHVLDDAQAYTSPMLLTIDGTTQVLIVTATRVVGLGIDDGRFLWDYPWQVSTVPNVAQPLLIGNSQIFLSASYGKGAVLLEVSKIEDTFVVDTVWENNHMKNKHSSSVLHSGYIYGLDEAILACISASTGERQWKGGRYGYGQLLLAGDHLIILSERGDLVLVKATPDGHQEIAGFRAIEGKTWNVPALANGRLFVRNSREMASFDLRH